MTRLVLIRHGESVSTVERRIGGVRTCGGLSPLGRKQAEALATRLARTGELQPDVLVASTIRRAVETAEIIAPAVGDLPIEQIADLGEHEPGPDCDGMTFDAFVEQYGRPDWMGDPYLVGFPGGESVADFKHRAAAALHQVAHDHEGATVMIVCHAGVIDVGLRSLLDVSMFGVFELSTTNTSITELLHTGPRWRMIRYNDAAHLEGLPHETNTA
jgi:probable phosphoglycerate mutase